MSTPTIGEGEAYFKHRGRWVRAGRPLSIVGRSMNVLSRSGEKVVPSNIEDVLCQFEGVRPVACFGIPSESHGENICVVVECAVGKPILRLADLKQAILSDRRLWGQNDVRDEQLQSTMLCYHQTSGVVRSYCSRRLR